MRYHYLGDKLTDERWRGQPCDPVRRPDGKCVCSSKRGTALVRFGCGTRVVVLRRRLRLVGKVTA